MKEVLIFIVVIAAVFWIFFILWCLLKISCSDPEKLEPLDRATAKTFTQFCRCCTNSEECGVCDVMNFVLLLCCIPVHICASLANSVKRFIECLGMLCKCCGHNNYSLVTSEEPCEELPRSHISVHSPDEMYSET